MHPINKDLIQLLVKMCKVIINILISCSGNIDKKKNMQNMHPMIMDPAGHYVYNNNLIIIIHM